MRQITLIRHAKVDIDDTQKIDIDSLQKWVELYDQADILDKSRPDNEVINIANQADIILTSNLKRAIDSAKRLSVDIYDKNSLFNESKIPKINIPLLKLTPKKWLVVLRVLSFLDIGTTNATLKESKTQAQKAARKLTNLSNGYNNILLIGHGGMNWFIRKALLKDGWDLMSKPSNKNWGTTKLCRNELSKSFF